MQGLRRTFSNHTGSNGNVASCSKALSVGFIWNIQSNGYFIHGKFRRSGWNICSCNNGTAMGMITQILVGLFTDIQWNLCSTRIPMQPSLKSALRFSWSLHLETTTFRYRRKPSAICSVHQSLSPPHVCHTTINLTLTGLLKIRRQYWSVW